MQGPGDTLVTHLACRREWAFRHDRAVARLRGQRLQHQGSPIRLTEAIDAPWGIVLVAPIDPAVQLVGPRQALSGHQAPALTMSARVGQQDGIAMIQERLAVPGYAFAIVGNAVQRDYDVAVELPGMNVPALQLDAVRSRDADLSKARVITFAGRGGSFLPMPQRTVNQLYTGFADDHPGYGGEKNIDAGCHQQDLEQLTH